MAPARQEAAGTLLITTKQLKDTVAAQKLPELTNGFTTTPDTLMLDKIMEAMPLALAAIKCLCASKETAAAIAQLGLWHQKILSALVLG